MDRKYDAKTLLTKYRNGTADAQERLLVEQFLLVDMAQEAYLPTPEKITAATEAIGKAIVEHADQYPARDMVVRPLRPWYRRFAKGWVAAAAVILVALGLFLLRDTWQQPSGSTLASEEIQPGGNRATLTLADGRILTLDEAQSGIIIVADEDITYSDGVSLGLAPADTLLLTTPKGGTYQITLPDGSHVWLNANSILKYPSRFSGDVREVFLEGEAFFAVNSQLTAIGNEQSAYGKGPTAERLPFRVVTRGQTVDVLGTQFNISAYADDPKTKTTLVEGSVRLRAGASGADVSLKPGEQANLTNGSITTTQVNTEPYTAWRQGLFVFDETPLEEIMRAISRWYDVEVVYRDESLRMEPFVGVIDRFSQVSDVLSLLEFTGHARFEVAGRTIIVSPLKKSK